MMTDLPDMSSSESRARSRSRSPLRTNKEEIENDPPTDCSTEVKPLQNPSTSQSPVPSQSSGVSRSPSIDISRRPAPDSSLVIKWMYIDEYQFIPNPMGLIKIENLPKEWAYPKIIDFLKNCTDRNITNKLVRLRRDKFGNVFINLKGEHAGLVCEALNDIVCVDRKLVVTQYIKDKRVKELQPPSEKKFNAKKDKFTDWAVRIHNFPKYYNWNNVKGFLEASVGSELMEHIAFIKDNHGNASFTLYFDSVEAYNQALEVLPTIECEGTKLIASPDNYQENKAEDKNKSRIIYKQGTKKARHLMEVLSATTSTPGQDKNDTFGLSTAFLQSLGITPPLINKIFVSNLAAGVDEAQLREVFGYAGQILNVKMLPNKQGPGRGMAKIEFDHPVEAVQAISLFHNQGLMGQLMSVQVDNSSAKYVVPPGLTSIGKGLGPNGEPLKGIRNLVELQSLKQSLMQEITQLKQNMSNQSNAALLSNPLNLQSASNPLSVNTNTNPLTQSGSFFGLNCIAPPNVTPWMNTINNDLASTVTTAFSRPDFAQGLIMGQGLNAQTPPPVPIPPNPASSGNSNYMMNNNMGMSNPPSHANMGMSNPPNHASSGNPNYMVNNHMGMSNNVNDSRRGIAHEENKSSTNDSDMLIFKNLPSSVTLQVLTNKMREVGEVRFAELTGGGRAIVRFARPSDADRCLQLFDRSKVDGQSIEVKLV